MKKLILTTCVAAMMLSCNQQKNENPFFAESTAPFGAPMFELIKSDPNVYYHELSGKERKEE